MTAMRATFGRAKDRLAATAAAAGKDDAAIGTHLCPGSEFHPAVWADEEKRQVAGRATLIILAHRRAAAGTEGVPAGGTRRIAHIDARAALRAGWAVVWFRPRLGPGFGYGSVCRLCPFGWTCGGWGGR